MARLLRFVFPLSVFGLCTALGFAPLETARGQSVVSIRAGQKVRINVSSPTSHRVQGRLLTLSPDTITLRGPSEPVAIGLSDVSLLEVKRRSGRSFIRSVAYGLLAGAVAGAAIGTISLPSDTGDGRITGGDKLIIGGFLGGVAGLFGGTVYGVCCASGWEPVPVSRSR